VKNRDNATLWGTDQEHKLRCPDDPFFKKFAAEASRVQIAVDVFVLGCARARRRLFWLLVAHTKTPIASCWARSAAEVE
jgi:hypothetical protein